MRGDYKQRIYSFLMEADVPVDVEKIRVACGIGNWNTALKHCLELLIQGRAKGMKTSNGWVFWIEHGGNVWTEGLVHESGGGT